MAKITDETHAFVIKIGDKFLYTINRKTKKYATTEKLFDALFFPPDINDKWINSVQTILEKVSIDKIRKCLIRLV